MITLYTAATPNGQKVSVALEELGLVYKVHALDLAQRQQKQDWYLAINPNGRIPAIVDHEADEFPVFESGAILLYLAEKTGRLIPQDAKGRARAVQWLMFQMSGVGPIMGQAKAFLSMAEKNPAAIERFQKEARRLFEVLDHRLGEQHWLAGDAFSVADIANFCWVRLHGAAGVSIDRLTHLKRWLDEIAHRPKVQAGLKVPLDLDQLARSDTAKAAG